MASFCVVSNIGLLMNREKFNIHAREEIFLPTYRGIGCSLYTSNCSSASFPSLTCNGFCKPYRWLVCDSKIWSLVDRNGRDMQTHFRSYEFVSPPFLGFQGCYKSQHRLFCNRRTISAFNGNGRERETLAGKVGSHSVRRRKSGSNGVRRRKSLRLRARVRLLFMRLRRFSVWSMLNELGTFLRRDMKRLAIYTSFVVTLGLCYLFLSLSASTSPKMVPYSDLVMSLQNGSVTKVLFEEGSHCIYFNTRSQNPSKTENAEDESPSSVINATNENVVEVVANKVIANSTPVELVNVWRNFFKIRASNPEWQYSTRKINEDVSFLLSLMREKDATYGSAPQPVIKSLRSILVTILSLWIPMSPLMWLLYRQFSSAKSPAKTRRPSSQAVSFDDVEGVDAAKVELMEIISCLQGLKNYNKLGAKLPRGVLLIGPPGTGKTLLARVVAGEAGIPFLIVSASEFVELFVGRGAARIRELFNMARKCAPSIIFIDELDAVGGKRGGSFNDERDQTLNQLLTEMDGFESDMKVVVIAATNRPEALDPALCRAGRFSRKVMVGEPDEEGRRKILAVHFREVPLEEEMTIICNLVASITQGFVGADLANIVNEAALLAARRGGETVTREDIVEAIERAKYGINDTHRTSNIISKEIGKLFPWMPSLLGRNDPRQDKLQGPLGDQTLS